MMLWPGDQKNVCGERGVEEGEVEETLLSRRKKDFSTGDGQIQGQHQMAFIKAKKNERRLQVGQGQKIEEFREIHITKEFGELGRRLIE